MKQTNKKRRRKKCPLSYGAVVNDDGDDW